MRLPPGITLSVEDKPAEADVDALPEGLETFNEQQWPGHQPWQTLGVFLRRGARWPAGCSPRPTPAGCSSTPTGWMRGCGAAALAAA
ncbi:hypothetical protein GCM10011504_10130 [Siccirubricoccus deserti]|nr:hypothetical protein GCM10011504_10130 [Siccirubricoccus deserti]